MPSKRQRVSLADVAAAAGVGVATASRALSRQAVRDIGEGTRTHVRAVAEQLGYSPNRTAQALRTGRHQAIGLVVPLKFSAGWAPLIEGAARQATERDFQLLVHPVAETRDLTSLLESLQEHGLDAAIVLTGNRLDPALNDLPMPVVLIDDLEPSPTLPTIRSNNREGGRVLARHLLDQGRRAPVIIAPEPDWFFAAERIAGFRAVYEEAGIDLAADRVIVPSRTEGVLTVSEDDIRTGISAVAGPVDAVFAITDLVAASALRTLRHLDLRVPTDVAVVGYDDERTAQLVDPPLTTMRQHLQGMGATAVVTLLGLLTNEAPPTLLQELPAELVVRATS